MAQVPIVFLQQPCFEKNKQIYWILLIFMATGWKSSWNIWSLVLLYDIYRMHLQCYSVPLVSWISSAPSPLKPRHRLRARHEAAAVTQNCGGQWKRCHSVLSVLSVLSVVRHQMSSVPLAFWSPFLSWILRCEAAPEQNEGIRHLYSNWYSVHFVYNILESLEVHQGFPISGA